MKLFILSTLLLTCMAEMKIYIFNVGQADSQLIVFPSGYSVLIDLGEERNDPNPTNAIKVGNKIEQILGKKHIDVTVLTHIHLDHFGYTGISGLWYLFEKMNFTTGKYIERNVGNYTGTNRADCNSKTYDFFAAGEFEDLSVEWVCYADSLNDQTKLSKIREIAQMCSTSQINPPDEGAEVEIVTTNAKGVYRADGLPIEGNYYNQPMMPSENSYSIGLRIQYGKFVYSTSGDLDGGYYYSYGNTISDIEATIKDVVGQVDVFRANHHGSRHSNSWDYLNVAQPAVSVISCGINNTYGHPNENAAYRMSKTSQKVYATNKCNPDIKYDNYVEMEDDVIITVSDVNATTFTVTNWDGSYSQSYAIKLNKNKRAKCIVPKSADEQTSGSSSIVLFLILCLFFLF